MTIPAIEQHIADLDAGLHEFYKKLTELADNLTDLRRQIGVERSEESKAADAMKGAIAR